MTIGKVYDGYRCETITRKPPVLTRSVIMSKCPPNTEPERLEGFPEINKKCDYMKIVSSLYWRAQSVYID
jgi:hypothetical protein